MQKKKKKKKKPSHDPLMRKAKHTLLMTCTCTDHGPYMGTGTTYLPQYQHHYLSYWQFISVGHQLGHLPGLNQLLSAQIHQFDTTDTQGSHSEDASISTSLDFLRCRKHPEHHHNQLWDAEHHVNSLIWHFTTFSITNGRHWPLASSIITEACSTNQKWQYIDFADLPPMWGKQPTYLPPTCHSPLVLAQLKEIEHQRHIIPDFMTWLQCFSIYITVLG